MKITGINVSIGIPIFQTSQGKDKWFEKSESSSNGRKTYSVRLGRRKRLLVPVIGRCEEMRVRETGISLYL